LWAQRALDAEGHERRRREGVSKAAGEKPEGAENTRGDRVGGRSNPPVFHNGLLLGQSLEGELSGSGSGGATRREEKLGNDRKA